MPLALSPRPLRYGMRWTPGAVKLRFRDYLVPAHLPAIPKHFGHALGAPPVAGGWQMYSNSQYGDCVAAGACHEDMLWAWATGRPIPVFAKSVVPQYLNLTGGKDDGLDPAVMASYRRKSGLYDDTHTRHFIKAYAQLDDLDHMLIAMYLFGAAGLCLELPDSAEDQFNSGEVWDDLTMTPNPANGHYVPAFDVNSRGNIVVCTWGQLHAMTPDYARRYWAGGLAYFSMSYLLASDLSPEAFNEAQLDSDLKELSA